MDIKRLADQLALLIQLNCFLINGRLYFTPVPNYDQRQCVSFSDINC